MKNERNRVVFIGEFFGLGPYVIDVIMNIVKLKKRFDERVKIILGYNDINKLRFKYELNRLLLKQKFTWPGYDGEIGKDFDNDGRGMEFGRKINLNERIEKFLKEEKKNQLLL